VKCGSGWRDSPLPECHREHRNEAEPSGNGGREDLTLPQNLKRRGQVTAESGWSRASLAAVGTLIVTAPSAPSVPASIITPIQAGTAPLFM